MLVKNESPETSRAEGLERDRNLQGIILRALGEVGPKIIGSSPDGSCQIPNEREMQHLLGCDEVNLGGPTPHLLLFFPGHPTFGDIPLQRKSRIKVRARDAVFQLGRLAQQLQ